MRILYVARHGQVGTSNDDEGAIAAALRLLDHDVCCVHESEVDSLGLPERPDLLLFHKWDDLSALVRLRRHWGYATPAVFWFFDLVDHPDPALANRCRVRRNWMERFTPHVDLGFCTDGDWVRRDTTGKLICLRQGADERVVGRGDRTIPALAPGSGTILLSGIYKGGTLRMSFINEMHARYGSRFRHVQQGIYGRDMADLVASTAVVVAPDGPSTDHYWSNRVYNACGFGAFLVHPYCTDLLMHYDDTEVAYYDSREGMHDIVERALAEPMRRQATADRALARTLAEHLYRHRCVEMLRQIGERLAVV